MDAAVVGRWTCLVEGRVGQDGSRRGILSAVSDDDEAMVKKHETKCRAGANFDL
jgi:hypothetical protein